MNPEIIIMLTNNDITVTNAEEVFESCKDLPAKKWGFKDIGIWNPFAVKYLKVKSSVLNI